jgi:hypothetical protein
MAMNGSVKVPGGTLLDPEGRTGTGCFQGTLTREGDMAMARKMILAVIVLGVCTLATNRAQAQFLKFGPNGSVGIRNGVGTYTYIHPNRLNLWANLAVPGSMQQLPNGQVWQGWDGQLHGNLYDPSTGNFHAFRHDGPSGQGRHQNNQFLVEPSGNPGPQPRRMQADFNWRWRSPPAQRRWP